jgi:hypothetical protein
MNNEYDLKPKLWDLTISEIEKRIRNLQNSYFPVEFKIGPIQKRKSISFEIILKRKRGKNKGRKNHDRAKAKNN